MAKEINWNRVIYITGVVALIVGAIDPLEGSILITAGSVLVAIATHLLRDRHNKIFLASSIMIVFGVFFLFYLSSFGGFGGDSSLSWWWGTLILPYPIGWLLSIITLIIRAVNKRKTH